MREEFTITFYSIDRCGYYETGQEKCKFGEIRETLEGLRTWVFSNNMQIGGTCTYDLQEGQNTYHTYCYDLIKDHSGDSYLLATWNEIPSVDGNVASINGGSPVKDAEVSLTELPAGNIPGYASYFWFIPSLNSFATVRPKN
jgi:hypothetical protein